MIWYILFFLVLLKIPVLYLCYVVWWAVKEAPQPGEGLAGGGIEGAHGPDSSGWWRRARRREPVRRGPHGSPLRRPARAVARARATPPA